MFLTFSMKFDLHMHSRFSPDSQSCPKGIVERALQLGYGLIAITDHDSNAEAFDWLVKEKVLTRAGMVRPEWVKERGYGDAKLRVLPGQEISTATGHLLCLIARLTPCWGIAASEAIQAIHAEGGVAIPAHPFDGRRAAYSEEELDALPFDAIEVVNGGATNHRVNEFALDLAKRRQLPGVANSDGHTLEQIGRCYSEAEAAGGVELCELLGSRIETFVGVIEPRVVEVA
jgi:predicted metal-dependent phosphoesterase TrpH